MQSGQLASPHRLPQGLDDSCLSSGRGVVGRRLGHPGKKGWNPAVRGGGQGPGCPSPTWSKVLAAPPREGAGGGPRAREAPKGGPTPSVGLREPRLPPVNAKEGSAWRSARCRAAAVREQGSGVRKAGPRRSRPRQRPGSLQTGKHRDRMGPAAAQAGPGTRGDMQRRTSADNGWPRGEASRGTRSPPRTSPTAAPGAAGALRGTRRSGTASPSL